MARTPFSLLLLRRLSLSTLNPRLPRLFTAIKPLSTSSDSSPHSSLSARMSFVFDQIDAMEKERFDKDETLHRIRAWRESKKAQSPEPDSELSRRGETVADSAPEPKRCEDEGGETKSEVELVHPWPEWIELMERLVQQNYFDHRRKDEDKMIDDLGFDPAISQAPWAGDITGLDFKNFKLVQTACINFGKDRFDVFRSLSRQDIQTLVGFGCPSADKKVVFSAKLLRKHVHLDEGDVCSSCSLRSSCDRAYLLTMKEDEARFIDIMRVLLAYGFDPLNGAELNPSPMKQKSVKTVVRKLLHQVVRLSSVPIDPNLPPPIIRRPPPKVKQPPPPPKKRVGRDDIEMKKGDWLCPKCDFMNFAKNNVCLQCDAKRPKRQLLPGEWECPQCNFLNYRRNIVCFHCDCKRPPDEFTENKMQEKQQGPRMRAENMTNRSEVSNAWNFDFDDDESDGADVAAFEYADSSAMEKGPFDNRGEGGMSGKPEHDFNRASRDVRGRDGEYSDADSGRPGIGFDDFNDEDDDVDNYEIDNGNSSVQTMASSDDFPNFERRSRSEAIYGFDKNSQSHRAKLQSYNSQSKPTNRRACFGSDDDDDDDVDLESDSELSAKRNSHRGSNPLSHNNQFKVVRKRRAFSGSEDDELDSDSDSELSAKPKWKSSHVSDSRPRGRGKGSKGPSKSLSFGSDDELGLYSDMDDEPNGNFRSKQGKDNDFRRRGSSRMKDSFSVLESDNEDSRSYGNRPRGNVGPNRGPSDSKGRNKYNSTRDTRQRSGGMKNSRNSFEDDDDEDFGGSSRGSRGRGSSARTRMNDRNGSARNFKEPRSAGFGKKGFEEPRTGGFRKQHHGRRDGHGRDLENGGVDEFKNSRRVIER